MGQRSEDNAGTVRLLFLIAREVAKAKLPAHGSLVLAFLDQQPEGRAKFSEVRSACDLPVSQVSYICEQLVETGLVKRTIPPRDRRTSEFELTAAGRTVFSDLTERVKTATHSSP